MGRVHLFEIEDQPWFPARWRRFVVDHLSFVQDLTGAYASLAPVAAELLDKSGSRRLVDLCSGAGAAPVALQRYLHERGEHCEVLLTDLYPNLTAFRARAAEAAEVSFSSTPVDATRVPEGTVGVRTLFNSFHHLPPEGARALLADAAEKRQPLLVVESVGRSFEGVVLVGLITLAALVLPLFVKPFSLERLAWSWLFPVVPFVVAFDGLVSCLRIYSDDELRELTRDLDGDYRFEQRRVPLAGLPFSHRVLLGYPV